MKRKVPKREEWLYKNLKALKMVRKGIAQAKAGKLKPMKPLLDKFKDLENSIEEEE